ncbi:MAG: hypothetical protein HFE73_09490 [Firmicutes bacterium]|nr:hypothetical protein [Bacillota bacterium]
MKKFEKKTTQKAAEKKPFDAKAMFNNENYGNGLRCVIICILAVVLVVGINIFAAALPTQTANLDVSTEKIHSISDDTKKLVSKLEKPVEVYLVCEKGEENDNTTLMLNLYADQSDRLTVEQVDPAFSPQMVEQYTGKVAVDNNTIIVVSGERRQILNYGDYFAGTSFVLEDYLNSAIQFVTSDTLKKVYFTSGHGASQLADSTAAYLGLDGYEPAELKLMEQSQIPEDAYAVVVNGLTEDLTEKEANVLLDYMKEGGRLVLVTGYSDQTFTNLEKVTGYFGAYLEKGIVAESDQSRYMEDNPANVLPYILTEGNQVLTDGVEYVLMPNSKGIIVDKNLRDTVEVSTILQTSDTAASLFTNIFTSSQETIEGPFKLGVSFKEKANGGEARMIWFSSQYISDASIDAYVGGGNLTMFLSAISWVSEEEPVASIHGKTISTQFLTIDSSALNVWKVILVGGIPLIILAIGIVVTIRRKRR